MKAIIAGPRDFDDYKIVVEAIEKSGFDITEVVSGDANGVDKMGERWGRENGIPVVRYPAKWKELDQPGAIVKTNQWGGEYNANAGFYRNEQMGMYADCLIAIDDNTPGTGNMIKVAKHYELKIFKYSPKDWMNDGDYIYIFGS